MTTKAYNDLKNKVSNKYLDFIKLCREKEKNYKGFSAPKNSQIHHIVPRHHFKSYNLDSSYFDLPENLILLSFEDHVKAHEIRFDVYGEYADKLAYTKMTDMGQGMLAFQQAGGQAANVIFKKEGRNMHDPEWQKEMAARSMARPDAREIRSVGGKIGNRISRSNKTVFLDDKYLWKVDDFPFLCTFGLNNGGDVLRELYKARPTPLQRVSPLLNGSKKKLHGWSCEKIE